MLTRVFQSGNSIAVRIPKELAIVEAAQDVEIERVGNTLVIRPVQRRSLKGIARVFSGFSADFMADGRGFHEEKERTWGEPTQEQARRPGRKAVGKSEIGKRELGKCELGKRVS